MQRYADNGVRGKVDRQTVVVLLIPVALVVWLYGLFSGLQMLRHKLPGVQGFPNLAEDKFTEEGNRYRRRFLGALAAFAAIILVAWLVAPDAGS